VALQQGVILMNSLKEECMRSMQQQLGTWEPSQHLIKDRKTKKTCVEMAGRRTFEAETRVKII
jgi:hypothetical protein